MQWLMLLIASAFLVAAFYMIVSLASSLRTVGDDITTGQNITLTTGETDALNLIDLMLPAILAVGAIGMMMAAMPSRPVPHGA